MKFYGQLEKSQLENLSSDPTALGTGHVYYNTASSLAKYYDGSTWQRMTGIPAYSTTVSYSIGDIVANGTTGRLFLSKTNSNLNNALTSTANWGMFNSNVTAVITTYQALITDDYLRCDPTSGSFVVLLPAIASTFIGQKIIVKNIASNGNTVTISSGGGTLIEYASTLVLDSSPTQDAVTLINGNGAKWDVI